MSCLNSTGVLLPVTFRGYALIIRIQETSQVSAKKSQKTRRGRNKNRDHKAEKTDTKFDNQKLTNSTIPLN